MTDLMVIKTDYLTNAERMSCKNKFDDIDATEHEGAETCAVKVGE